MKHPDWKSVTIKDLKKGDYVEDFGYVETAQMSPGHNFMQMHVGDLWMNWPPKGLVCIMEKVNVEIKHAIGRPYHQVFMAGEYIAEFASVTHADEYAELLRNDSNAAYRQEALGR